MNPAVSFFLGLTLGVLAATFFGRKALSAIKLELVNLRLAVGRVEGRFVAWKVIQTGKAEGAVQNIENAIGKDVKVAEIAAKQL